MSFSEKIKDELLMSKNKKCCILPMRYGELITESNNLKISDIKAVITKTCCKKAFLKGVFLGTGCIIDPQKDYHFEVIIKNKNYLNFLLNLMKEFNVYPKETKRGTSYVVYLKDSEQIATLLAVMEANKSYLEYENIRVSKSLKNDINRTVNCETANLNKIAIAAVKQTNAINKLIKLNKYKDLNSKLKEAADLRLKYPTNSLDELVKCSKFKTSKSGLYHRFRSIIKLAEEE